MLVFLGSQPPTAHKLYALCTPYVYVIQRRTRSKLLANHNSLLMVYVSSEDIPNLLA